MQSVIKLLKRKNTSENDVISLEFDVSCLWKCVRTIRNEIWCTSRRTDNNKCKHTRIFARASRGVLLRGIQRVRQNIVCHSLAIRDEVWGVSCTYAPWRITRSSCHEMDGHARFRGWRWLKVACLNLWDEERFRYSAKHQWWRYSTSGGDGWKNKCHRYMSSRARVSMDAHKICGPSKRGDMLGIFTKKQREGNHHMSWCYPRKWKHQMTCSCQP